MEGNGAIEGIFRRQGNRTEGGNFDAGGKHKPDKSGGVQIGLANHAEDGVLPWTAILNMGFGDGDGGGDTNVDDGDLPRAASR